MISQNEKDIFVSIHESISSDNKIIFHLFIKKKKNTYYTPNFLLPHTPQEQKIIISLNWHHTRLLLTAKITRISYIPVAEFHLADIREILAETKMTSSINCNTSSIFFFPQTLFLYNTLSYPVYTAGCRTTYSLIRRLYNKSWKFNGWPSSQQTILYLRRVLLLKARQLFTYLNLYYKHRINTR